MTASLSDILIASSGGRNDCLSDGARTAGQSCSAFGRRLTGLTARGEDRAPLARERS